MGALPSCLRGSWDVRRGTSLGPITTTFLMAYSRTPHPQVVVEALAAFRRQDLHRIGRSRLGGAARGRGRGASDLSPERRLPVPAVLGLVAMLTSGRQTEARQRPVDVVCDCTASKMLLLWTLAMPHVPKEPRRHDGSAPSAPSAPRPAQMGGSVYQPDSAF